LSLLDDVLVLSKKVYEKLGETCPNCGYKGLKQSGKRLLSEFECPQCHLRISVTTRNNERVAWAFIIVSFAFFVGVLIGVAL